MARKRKRISIEDKIISKIKELHGVDTKRAWMIFNMNMSLKQIQGL